MSRKRLSRAQSDQLRQTLHEDLQAGRLSLSEACRRMRRIVGMNQADYARWLGVAPRTYIDLERGVGNPTLETLNKVGRPFGLRVVFAGAPSPGGDTLS